MKLQSVVLLVALHLVSSRASVIKLSPHAAAHFQRLMVAHDELFQNEEEVQERLQNFIVANKIIDAHNNGPNGRYFQLDHNKMSILSDEEKSGMLGRVPPQEDRQVPRTTTTTTKKPTTTKTTTTKKPTTTKTTTTKKPTTTKTTTTKKPTTTKTTTTKKPTTTKTTTTKPTTTTASTTTPSTTTSNIITDSTTDPNIITDSTTDPNIITDSTTPAPISTTTSSPIRNSLDLRTSTLCGQQLPIKNQLGCGSCWAFSAIAPIEWAQCNKTGVYTRLSDEELVSCDTRNGGCNGGDPYASMGWIKSNQSGAVATELSYPYTSGGGITGTCRLSSPGIVTGATLASYTLLTCTVNSGTYASVTDIENAITNYGVVAACVLVNGALFNNYKSGVFVDPACQSKLSGKCLYTSTNHCGSLVGWGFNSTVNMPYWIFRNQWGTTWGDNGYMNIQKGVNMCGIESEIIYTTVV